MADDEISIPVKVDGADEAAAALKNLGTVGAAAFAQIAEAAAKGDFTGLASLIGGDVAGGFTKAGEAILSFVESTSKAVETMANLASASGTTTGQFQGLQSAFTGVGISAQGFDRTMGRLSQTIGQAWIAIQESSRTAADEELGAMLGIQEAALNTSKAYESLSKTMEQVSDQATHDQQNIVDAQLNVQKAQNTQLKSQGVDTSQSDALIKQQEQANAIVKARQALYDANQKAADDEAESVNKLKEAQLAVQKAQLAEAEAAEKAHQAELKDIGAVASAIDRVIAGQTKWNAETEITENSAQKLSEGLIKAAANGGAARPGDLDVLEKTSALFQKMGNDAQSMGEKVEIVQRLLGAGFRSGQASASQIIAVLDKGPEALQAMITEGEKFADSGIGISQTQVDTLKDFNAAMASLSSLIDQVAGNIAALIASGLTPFLAAAKTSLVDSNGALHLFVEGLQTVVRVASQVVSIFGNTFAAIVQVLIKVAEGVNDIVQAFSKFSGIAPDKVFIALSGAGLVFVGVMTAIGSSIALVMGRMEVWAVIIGTVTKAIAELVQIAAIVSKNDSLGKFGQSLEQGANSVLRSATGGLSDKLGVSSSTAGGVADPGAQQASADRTQAAATDADALKDHAAAATEAGTSLQQTGDAAANAASQITALGTLADSTSQALGKIIDAASSPQGKADGGFIRGPGTGTSDEAGLFALSHGEYVVRSAAVSHYGPALFEALNNLAVGGFATGGRVGGGVSVPRPSGPTTGGSSVLNLTIDGQHFNGLRAPNDVAQKLKMHAVSRQASATGRYPSWMR